MVVMIGHVGVYLIIALVFIVLVIGGVLLAYRSSTRQDE